MAESYAGFSARLMALVIDGLVVALFFMPVTVASGYFFGVGWPLTPGVISAALCIVGLIYSALGESSRHQATVGKMALGIKVTDLEGRRISFRRAAWRALGKLASFSVLLVGFVVAIFTKRRQALHDFMAGTLVVRS